MITYRPFINSDPPGLVALWHGSGLGRGAAVGFTTDAFERFVFSQPYFDPNGLIIAEEDGKTVGAVHAGFAPNEERTGLDHSRGVICALNVDGSCRGKGVGTELLKRAEQFLMEAGVKEIMAGPSPEDAPFYVGLYGGTTPAGFLVSDLHAAAFLTAHGYTPCDKTLIFQRDLNKSKEPINFRISSIRRKMNLTLSDRQEKENWWWVTRHGRLDTLRFGLEPKQGGPEVASLTIVGLDLYINSWQERSIGIIDIELQSGETDPIYRQVLISLVCQRLKEELITNIEIQCDANDSDFAQMLLGSGFEQVDEGIVYHKTL